MMYETDSDDGVYCEFKEYIKLAKKNLRRVKSNRLKNDESQEGNVINSDKEDLEREKEENEEGTDKEEANEEIENKTHDEGVTDNSGNQSDPIENEEQHLDYQKAKSKRKKSKKSRTNIEETDDESIHSADDLAHPSNTSIEDQDSTDNIIDENIIGEIENEDDNGNDLKCHSANSNYSSCEENNNNINIIDDTELETLKDDDDHLCEEIDDENCDSDINEANVNECSKQRNIKEKSFNHNNSYETEENLNVSDPDTLKTEEIDNENTKQLSEEELITDDEVLNEDAFNVQYRYVLRYPKNVRRSQQPIEEEILEESEKAIDLEATTLEERIKSIGSEDDDVAIEDDIKYESDPIEALYDFIFNDPLQDLKNISSNRSSKSSTEVDGLMSSAPKIFDNKIENFHNKIENFGNKIENVDEKYEFPPPNQESFGDTRLNTRALSKEAKTYELEKFSKNVLVIFNQENINGYKPRFGTKQDVEALTKTFECFNFDVVEHLDLTRDEIFDQLQMFSQTNFTDYGCIAIAVLTHGSDMDALRAKDRLFYQNDIIKYLKTSENPTLVTKPKILIIQACRGSETSTAVAVGRVGKISKDYVDAFEHRTYTLPVESDILIVHSTFAGKISYRDETNGTWFIQTLCDKINTLANKEDLESILTEVKKTVAIDKSLEEYNRRTLDIEVNKQIPVIVSSLIRKLYLRKAGEISMDDSPIRYVTDNNTDIAVSEKTPCSCVQDRFEYIKNCMRNFLEDNESDETGKSFLEVADTLADGPEMMVVKERLSKVISNHLMVRAKDCDYYKYLYFFKD